MVKSLIICFCNYVPNNAKKYKRLFLFIFARATAFDSVQLFHENRFSWRSWTEVKHCYSITQGFLFFDTLQMLKSCLFLVDYCICWLWSSPRLTMKHLNCRK